ncbi:MAG TPA: VOC family protein [Terriglobales bacterium]|nr:VOC family protein [Terriglobales bacterium]
MAQQQQARDERGEPVSLGKFDGHEIYPMPMFAKIVTTDVAATTEWYEKALGFVSVFRGPSVGGQPMMVHLRRHKYQDVLLVASPQPGSAAGPGFTLNFSAEGEVDELAQRARSVAAVGSSAIEGPVNTPWNTRDLNVTDPAGTRLVFTGRNPNPDPEQAARMRAMFEAARNK